MSIKICFIGSNGLLAKAFGNFFESFEDYLIDVYGRSIPTYKHNQFSVMDLTISNFEMKNFKVYDVIIYLAGEGIQTNYDAPISSIYRVNTFTPIELFFLLKSIDYSGTLITFGSYAEIGKSTIDKKFNELEIVNSSLMPPNDYVISKRILSNFFYQYKAGFKTLHFILPTIFGINEAENRLIPYILKCNRNNEQINLTSGEQIREFLPVSKVPDIINSALNNFIESGIYNIGGTRYKVKDLVLEIAQICNISLENIKFNTINRWDNSMPYLNLDNSKLEKLVSKNTSFSIEQEISLYKECIENRLKDENI